MCTIDPILTILVNPLLFTNRDVQTRITIAKISLTCTLERNTARHTPGLDWPLNKDNSQQNLCIRRSRTCHILNRITTPFHNFHRSGVLMSPVARDVSESLRQTISLQGSFSAISWTRMCRVPQNGVIENLSFFVEHWESNLMRSFAGAHMKSKRRLA